MIEIIYRVRFPGDFGFGCKSSKFHQILVHQTEGKYEVVEGVYDSYSSMCSSWLRLWIRKESKKYELRTDRR